MIWARAANKADGDLSSLSCVRTYAHSPPKYIPTNALF